MLLDCGTWRIIHPELVSGQFSVVSSQLSVVSSSLELGRSSVVFRLEVFYLWTWLDKLLTDN